MYMGEYEAAYKEAVAAAESPRNAASAWHWAARIAILMADPAKARAAIQAFESFPVKGRVIDAKRIELRAGLTALTGSATEALSQYADSFRAWREVGEVIELAHAQFTCAMLLGTGSPEGRAAALESLATHQRLGAAPWVAQLEQALEEGEKPVPSNKSAAEPSRSRV
jgi:hypothetical protein